MDQITNEYNQLDYKVWLSNELSKRCRHNSSYSMRAMAKLLNIDSSSLSKIIAGKRKISKKMLTKLADVLEVSIHERKALLNYIDREKNGNPPEVPSSSNDYTQVSLDTYALIADWYHYAILEITFIQDFKNCTNWISKKLGISVNEANLAIARLKRLNLLKEENGVLKKTEVFITNFSDGITSSALKKLQRHILEKALFAIDNTSQEEKSITSITFASSIDKLPEARKKITTFRRELCEFLENCEEKTHVFNLGIQLYPLTKD